MTATVTTHPSSPLAALDAATRNVNLGPDERAYYGGFILGWAAGMTIGGPNAAGDMVMEAKAHRWAATYTLADVAGRWELLGRNAHGLDHPAYLRACGLLAGWKEGTAHRPDADDCVCCDARVLTDEEGVRCEHGVFCNEDCANSVCIFRCYEPEFDDEAYYERKYGA